MAAAISRQSQEFASSHGDVAGGERSAIRGRSPATAAGASGAPHTGREAASPRLEDPPNNRKHTYEPTGKVYMRPHRCRCRTCRDCGPRYGYRVRARFMDKAVHFQRPGLFSLTIDRAAFASPPDAFLTVTQGGYIRRLMRLLGVKRWCWVLEFQMKTGDGWPHWHLVIDLPPGGIDLARAWRLWRDKWGLGGLDLQRKPNESAAHALFYITKYLTKFPDSGFPAWVDHFPKRIRWVGASGSVGRIVSDREPTADDVPATDTADTSANDAAESLPIRHRPYAIRKADCHQLVEFFRETSDGESQACDFFGRLPLAVVEAARKGSRGRKGLRVRQDADGREYLLGDWDTFADLANRMLEAAHAGPGLDLSRCERDRLRAMRGSKQAGEVGHVEG